MRVTDLATFTRATQATGASRSRAEEALQIASTGLKLTHPGDDPAGAGLVTMHRAAAARADTIATTAQRAADELAAVDGALDQVSTGLAQIREVAVRLSTSTYGASDRAAGAREVTGIVERMLAALNTKVGDRYVFAGTADGTQPFVAGAAPNTWAYQGDQGTRSVEVAPGVLQQANVRGDVLMTGAPATAGGPVGTDLLGALGTLVTALQNDDQATVQASLGALEAATAQVADQRGLAGVAMNAFDAAVTASRTVRDDAITRAAALTDADAIEANTQLALAQSALQASFSATAQGFKLSLLNYLSTG